MNFRAVAAIAMVAALSSPSIAAAAVISTVRVDATGSGGARVAIAFSGAAGTYRVVGTGTDEVTLQFAQTQAAAGVPAVIPGAGPVVSVQYAALGQFAQVVVRLASALPVRVTSDARNVYVDVAAPAAATPPPFSQPFASPQTLAGGGEVVEVVPLKYADVGEVVGVLVSGQSIPSNDTFAPQPSQLGQTSPLTTGGYGGTFGGATFGGPVSQIPQQNVGFGGVGQGVSLGQKVSDQIAIDRRLNAIILTGTADQVAALKATIAKIDVPLPSVLLETQIVELTDTAAKDIGIDYSPNGILATASYTSKSLQTAQASLQLQANVYAAISHGQGHLLARPSVLAQNGVPASILTGDAIPIVTTISSFASTTVTQQQVNYITVGVNLQIQPRITSDGYVTSHVYAQISNVSGTVQTFPQISQRAATTQATVRDGEAFVIGGLIQQNEINTVTKVPGLGDIPLIGGLFRSRIGTRQATNLYIIVTPHIIAAGGSNPAPGAAPPPVPVPTPTLPTPAPTPQSPNGGGTERKAHVRT